MDTDPRHVVSEPRLPTQLNRPLAAAGAQGTATATMLAGVAWISVAVLDGYLASAQWSYLPTAGASPDAFQAYAVVNVVAAIVSLVFGLLLAWRPTPGRLAASIGWAGLSVLGATLQAAGGSNVPWVFFGTMMAAFVAAAMSWAARPTTARPR